MRPPSILVVSLSLALLALAPIARAEEPSWKPDAADLLFASSRDGNSEIYLLRGGKGEWTNLSRHEAGDNWPVWSPDGSRIAFQSRRSGNLDIWVMNADGTGQSRLTDDPEPDYLPAWSPDGTTILFTSWRKASPDAERAPRLYVMKTDGSGQRRFLVEPLGTSAGGTWSPDGKRIVYARAAGKDGADIYVADYVADGEGRNETRLTQDDGLYNGSPTFSPDGRHVAFYSDDGKASALVIVGVSGKDRRTVLGEGQNWYPRWSPDGRWLIYTAPAGPSAGEDNLDLFAVPVAGGKPVPLAGAAPSRDIEGSWRP